jgi:hypothetical protein
MKEITLAKDFPPVVGFPGEHVFPIFLGASAAITTTLAQPHFTFTDTLWSRISQRAFVADF